MRGGSPRPTSASTPSANAMSVAVGIGHPSVSPGSRTTSKEEQGGHDHTADGGDRRDERLPRAVQLAVRELVTQLDRGEEEEDREQAVGDPVTGGEVDAPGTPCRRMARPSQR